MPSIAAFIDAWHPMLWGDKLFDTSHPFNRDDVTRPWIVLKEAFEAAGIEVHTADLLLHGRIKRDINLYYAIGQRDHYPLLRYRPDVRLMAYWQLEPPVVDPAGYRALPTLHKAFERVYTHNPDLFGGTKLYWPQVKDGFLPGLTFGDRKRLCMINANKLPHPEYELTWITVCADDKIKALSNPELYSDRRIAVDALQGRIDLYGSGWNGLPGIAPDGLHFDAGKPRPNLGPVPDKFEVLKQYDFAICFENQRTPGYITEKIFECMFAGTVPIYLGAQDIAEYVDRDCFIDVKACLMDGAGYESVWGQIAKGPEPYRQAMARYFQSDKFRRFTCQHFAQSVVATALQSLEATKTG